MRKLNPEQSRAVKTIDRPLLVLAGAGSGKPRVITEKLPILSSKVWLRAILPPGKKLLTVVKQNQELIKRKWDEYFSV